MIQHASSEEKASGMGSYEIPPAPKPFNMRLGNQLPSQSTRIMPATSKVPCTSSISELDVRPVKSSIPAKDDKEYYIAFPPSGLPVHSK